MNKEHEPSWSEKTRLEFIERVLYWRGWINRVDLVKGFGLSLPQATNDLVTYSTLSQGECAYNIRTKRYETSKNFKPILTVPMLWSDLKRLEPVLWEQTEFPLLAEPEQPIRQALDVVCKTVSRAIFTKEALEICYWSAENGGIQSRFISPRTFANDGLRIHTRAFCHRDKTFKDFNLSRIESIVQSIPCPFSNEVDLDWETFVKVTISANPNLKLLQRQALERDYGMIDGDFTFSVRKALLIYSMRRLGFIKDLNSLPITNEIQELVLQNIE